MRKTLEFISTGLAFLSLALPAYAQPAAAACPTGGPFSIICTSLEAENLGKIIGSLISLIFFGALLIALLFLIWGGVKWLASGGDKTSVEGARNHITAAIIGLVIIFLAYLIINVISFFFFGQGIGGITLPRFGQ